MEKLQNEQQDYHKKMVLCSFTDHKFYIGHLQMCLISLNVRILCVSYFILTRRHTSLCVYQNLLWKLYVCVLLFYTYLWKIGQLLWPFPSESSHAICRLNGKPDWLGWSSD